MIDYPNGLITINLDTNFFQETFYFYSEFLQFELIHERVLPDGKKVALLQLKENRGFRMVLTSGADSDNRKGNFFININRSDCEKIYIKMKSENVYFSKEFTSYPHMNYFICRDPAGNSIEVSEIFPDMIDWGK